MQCSSNREGQLRGVLYPFFFLSQCSPTTLEDIKRSVVFMRMLLFLWFVRHSSLSHLRHVGDADAAVPSDQSLVCNVCVTFLASPQPAWSCDRCAAKNCTRCSQRGIFVSSQLDASSPTLEIILSLSKVVTCDYSVKSKMKHFWHESLFLPSVAKNDLINISAAEAQCCASIGTGVGSYPVFSRADQRSKIDGYGVFISSNTILPDLPD